MIELSEDRWQFYQDKINQWQWRKFVSNKVVAVSSDASYSRQACVIDAQKRGYLGPITVPRKPRSKKLE